MSKYIDFLNRNVIVLNESGLHARPASLLVQSASKYESEILIQKEGEEGVDVKSIMNIMLLAAGEGTKLTLLASGDDAEIALNEIEQLFKDKFGE